jgi:fructose-1,6-bisphosphatase/inositol monophosphatase family enzyme
MTSASPPSERVQGFLTFGEQLVREQALPILSQGYAELVTSLHTDEQLAEVARRDGIDAALNHPTLGVLRKAKQEFATPAELRAERAMTDRVLATEKFSGHSVLGEELGAADQVSPEGGPNIRWVFDPVDGTTSMLRTAVAQAYGIGLPDSQPAFGVTIGVLESDEATAGVVAELRPAQGGGLEITRLWTGGSGVSATCNGKLVAAGPAVSLAEATLASTVPEVMFHSAEEWRDFQALHEVVERCVTGQNCIGFMELLGPDGKFNVVLERDLTAPDTAALVPILVAAGVQVTDAQGNPLRFGPEDLEREYVVLAASRELHALAQERIRSGPDGPSTFGQWKAATGVDVAKTAPGRDATVLAAAYRSAAAGAKKYNHGYPHMQTKR